MTKRASLSKRTAPEADIVERERTVVATALELLGREWPPHVARLMAAPSVYVSDSALEELAFAVYAMKQVGVPADASADYFARCHPAFLDLVCGLSSHATTPGIADLEAKDVCERAEVRNFAREWLTLGEQLNRGGDASQITALARQGIRALEDFADRVKPSAGLSVRTPGDILALPIDPSENLVGNRLLTKGSKMVIAGAGGVGKSRLGLQLAACCIAGRPFVGLPTYAQGLRWLVLQAENDNTRLSHDLAGLKAWLGDAWPEVDRNLHIHTLETEHDAWLSLDNETCVNRIRRLLNAVKPDVVLVDALYNVAIGDLNKDADMMLTLTSLQQVIQTGNPKRSLVAIHHATTGKSGLLKLLGHDRASFGRNSKVLHSWARGQINIGPLHPDDNDLLAFVCGKANNGREYKPFAGRLNPEFMIYEPAPEVDVRQALEEALAEQTGQVVTTDTVVEFAHSLTKGDLVQRIMSETGCKKTAAYKAIVRAEEARAIRQDRQTKTYRVCRPIHE